MQFVKKLHYCSFKISKSIKIYLLEEKVKYCESLIFIQGKITFFKKKYKFNIQFSLKYAYLNLEVYKLIMFIVVLIYYHYFVIVYYFINYYLNI